MVAETSAVALTPLEIACGMPLGPDPGTARLPPRTDTTPRGALESAVARALRRPPCLVSFSGGQDSSAILALAVHVARREGLPLPVPATFAFPDAAKTDEREWQELVLRHLGLDDHVRIELTDELDAVGVFARKALLRHGLFWPANLHFHLPILEQGRGGSLLTGAGGDELGTAHSVLTGERLLVDREVRTPRQALHTTYRASPGAVKWLRELARAEDYMGDYNWLTPRGRRALRLRLAGEHSLPFGHNALLRSYYWRRRTLQVMRRNFATVARTYDVAVAHPFSEPRTLQAMTGTGGLAGHGDRHAILRLVVGDLLPAEILQRRTKASFNDPLWTDEATAFARSWSGQGLDRRIVDPDAVRREWLNGKKGLIATTMLQAAWLHDHGPRRADAQPSYSSTSPSSTS